MAPRTTHHQRVMMQAFAGTDIVRMTGTAGDAIPPQCTVAA
jgi:hypothetical protein